MHDKAVHTKPVSDQIQTISFIRGPLQGAYFVTRASSASLPKIEWQSREALDRIGDLSPLTEVTDATHSLPEDPAILSLLAQELGLEQRRGPEVFDDELDDIVSHVEMLDPFEDWPKLGPTETKHVRARSTSSNLSLGRIEPAGKVVDSGYCAAGPKGKGVSPFYAFMERVDICYS